MLTMEDASDDEFHSCESGEEKSECTILTSGRSVKLLHDGFIYHKDKTTPQICYWQCALRRGQDGAAKCSGRARTSLNQGRHTLLSTTDHNHAPDLLQTETARYRAALKRKAEEGSDRPEKIMRIVASDFSVEVLASTSKLAQRKMIQRKRKLTKLTNDPSDFDDIDPSFTRTFDGQDFLLHNVELDEGRMMIFSTVANLARLSKSKVVILDGTFSSAPEGFRQVFTIHGSIGSGPTPKFVQFVHALLPSKGKQVYKKALKFIKTFSKENDIDLTPPLILTVFELAEINAVKAIFPKSTTKGCFFHLAKNWWKKIQDLRLRGEYIKNIKLQRAFRQAEALAFLSPKEIITGFKLVKKSSPKPMHPFFLYLERNYVLGWKSRKTGPRFPPDFWSLEKSTLKDVPRTTNSIEGFHNKFNALFKGGNEQKFYSVLKAFKEEEQATSTEYMRFLQGNVPVSRCCKKVLKRNAKLKRAILVKHDDKKTLMEHIQGLAMILSQK